MRIEAYIKERKVDLESEEIDSPIVDSPEEVNIEEKQTEVVEKEESKQSGVPTQILIGTSMSDLIDQFEGVYEKKKADKEKAEEEARKQAEYEAKQLARKREAKQREFEKAKQEEQERAKKKAEEAESKKEIEEALKAASSMKEIEPIKVIPTAKKPSTSKVAHTVKKSKIDKVTDTKEISSTERGTTDKENIFGDLEIREVDVAFEGVGDFYRYTEEKIKTVEDSYLIETTVNDMKVADNASEYEAKEFAEAVAPIIEEVTDKAIDESLKFHNEKTRMDVHEALNEEVAYRLGKYERKRKARKAKDIVSTVIKYILILLAIIIIWSNEPIRLKIIETATNLFDIVQGLINGEEVNSNKFFQDLFNIKVQKGV